MHNTVYIPAMDSFYSKPKIQRSKSTEDGTFEHLNTIAAVLKRTKIIHQFNQFTEQENTMRKWHALSSDTSTKTTYSVLPS